MVSSSLNEIRGMVLSEVRYCAVETRTQRIAQHGQWMSIEDAMQRSLKWNET